MIDKSQLVRGILEGGIVKIISQEETYGYEIMERLQEFGFNDVKESTIYPILIRLEKKNIIKAVFKESPLGPKRKYYYITEDGKVFLEMFEKEWKSIQNFMNNIFNGRQ